MRVRDLIKNSIWIPGSSYDVEVVPKVSILLPTFRRGKSGFFRRAVDSILAQTLKDIELIIIDDASTDGTADQIDEYLKRDGRISAIRHPKNIGLPAVSEYEGYVRARAPFISFAFDDFIFREDAVEQLYLAALDNPFSMVYGRIDWTWRDGQTSQIFKSSLGSPGSSGRLMLGNCIPNAGVLLPRHIIEDIGFYDPHVVMARICDWDLWRRISQWYEIRYVDVLIGQEDGLVSGDSLGSTYALDHWSVSEWMRSPRNEKLRPQKFQDYDVFEGKNASGANVGVVIDSLARSHCASRGWDYLGSTHSNVRDDGYILVVTADYDASTSLCFEMLPPDVGKRVRIIHYNAGFGLDELVRATCVIFVRFIKVFNDWIDAAKALKIPMYLYMDDNLPLMVESGEEKFPGSNDYYASVFREHLNSFAGVLLTNNNLVEYFGEKLFHDNLIYFPVSIFDQRTVVREILGDSDPEEVTIAVTGGLHRRGGFQSLILPALEKLANDGLKINIIGANIADCVRPSLSKSLRITDIPFDKCYRSFLLSYAKYKPDFCVTAPSETINNIYKTLNPLLSALLLDAVAVLPENEVYAPLKVVGNAALVKSAGESRSWYQTLKQLLLDKNELNKIKNRNRAFCAEQFSGSVNEIVLLDMLNRCGGGVTWFDQTKRLLKLAAYLRQKPVIPHSQVDNNVLVGPSLQLNAYRKMHRYSWCHRILGRKNDMWADVAPAFWQLKAMSQENGWRRAGASLELSDSLHETMYREYSIVPPEGNIVSVSFAFAVDLVPSGQVGVEIVSPENKVHQQAMLNIADINLHEPVNFVLDGVHVKRGEVWAIRVFAKSTTPIYLYEFLNRRLFGILFAKPTPFMALNVLR